MNERVARTRQVKMTQTERISLLDVAMQSHDPLAYLDGVQASFDEVGRSHDALVVAVLRTLLRAGEIEMVMSLRAEWSDDGDDDPS